MFEYHADDDRYYSMHHPFTSPLDEDVPVLERAVNGETELFGQLRAKAYDAVINGVEVAGGSIRIHRRDVQALVFKALGMSEEMARRALGSSLTRWLRNATTRRYRVRDRAHADGAGADREYSRRHGVSEDCVGAGFDDRRAGRSGSEAIGRVASEDCGGVSVEMRLRERGIRKRVFVPLVYEMFIEIDWQASPKAPLGAAYASQLICRS